MATEPDERRWREKIDDVGRKRRGWIDGWALAFSAIAAASGLALNLFSLRVCLRSPGALGITPKMEAKP